MDLRWFRKIWSFFSRSDTGDASNLSGVSGSSRKMFPREAIKGESLFQQEDFWKGDTLLSEQKCTELRQRLLFKITTLPPPERTRHDLYDLAQNIRRTAHSVRIAHRRNLNMRQRLVNSLSQPRPDLQPYHAFPEKHGYAVLPNLHFRVVLSSLVLFFFVITTFLLIPFQIPVTRAAHLTYIEETAGKVFVVRDGLTFAASVDFSLQEGDVVFTRDDGFATIRFFDDSASRLGQNTRLEVKRLFSLHEPGDPSPDISTQIEVLLDNGKMWTRVLHLIGDQSRFVVDTQHASITATKKAAFDIHTQPQYSRVAVFDNVVDLAPRTDGKDRQQNTSTKSLTAGFQIEVSPRTSKTTLIAGQTDVQSDEKNDSTATSWIETNLAKDKLHVEKISLEREEKLASTLQSVSITPAEALSSSEQKKMDEMDEFDRQQSSFLRNYGVFIRGQALLVQKRLEEGMKLLLQFEGEVRTFMVNYPGLLAQDRQRALALHFLVEQKISEQKKELCNALPGDPLYPAKEILEESELFLYENKIDNTLVRLNQVEGKLLEMQDLVEQGNMDLAKRLFVRYETQMKHIAFELDDENYKKAPQKMMIIFDKQIQHMKILTVIEQSFEGSTREAMAKIRHDLLLKLRTLVRSPNHLLPSYLVVKLKALLATYLDQHIEDQEFVHSLNQLLILHGEKSVLPPTIPAEKDGENVDATTSDSDADNADSSNSYPHDTSHSESHNSPSDTIPVPEPVTMPIPNSTPSASLQDGAEALSVTIKSDADAADISPFHLQAHLQGEQMQQNNF